MSSCCDCSQLKQSLCELTFVLSRCVSFNATQENTNPKSHHRVQEDKNENSCTKSESQMNQIPNLPQKTKTKMCPFLLLTDSLIPGIELIPAGIEQ
jgi:hypothetical protein